MSEPSSPTPPQAVVDLAEACVRFVERAAQLRLDYTPETLPFLDHYIRSMPERPAREIIALVVPATGAYFGEVVRRALPGARWHLAGDDHSAHRIELDRCFLHFNPMGVALESSIQREADGWSAHFQVLDEDRDAVRASLETTGGVRPEDFYTFTVRFEVVQQIYDLLMARAAMHGETEVRFGPEIYRAAVDAEQPDELAS